MSYVGIDLDTLTILFKAADVKSACLISAMEFEHLTHCIFPVERNEESKSGKARKVRIPGFLTTMEQKILYRNITGNECLEKVGELMYVLHELLHELPDDPRGQFKLEQMAGPIELSADAGMPAVGAKPIIKMPSAPSLPVAPSIPSAPGIPSAPKIPSAPRIPSAQPTPPKAGSTTGKVWAIAEQTLLDYPQATGDLKELRRVVIDACEAEGINPGTAATQFGAWKRAKGL